MPFGPPPQIPGYAAILFLRLYEPINYKGSVHIMYIVYQDIFFFLGGGGGNRFELFKKMSMII